MSLGEYVASFLQTKRGEVFSYYLRASNAKVARTEELEPDSVSADWDANDQLVGVEVLAPLGSPKSRFAVQYLTENARPEVLDDLVMYARKDTDSPTPR